MVKGYIIGIDEVGRGPLAGPVMVGVVAVPKDFDWSLISGVNDSKQLTPLKRLVIFKQAKKLRQAGSLYFAVGKVSAKVIDQQGITSAIAKALKQALARVTAELGVVDRRGLEVFLDGGLKAPGEYLDQKTIIRGDASEPVIGLASIVAKVTRDNLLERLGARPDLKPYGLANHKGDGTSEHLAAIAKYGLSREHRRSFCRRFLAN